jgi:cell fate regulator YaaT (PSP1 superfamily)
MAKMQKATLDPSKISGYCGRLKCCLRYEDKTYTELKKRLPKKNARVKTKYGEGKVTGTQILTQLVIVELDDGPRVAVPLDELKVISSPVSARKKKDTTAKDNQQENVESKDDSQIQDSAAPPEQ